MKSLRLMLACTVLAITFVSSMTTLSGAEGDTGKLYTQCNIWYEKAAISSINYKTGSMIPAGTELSDVKLIERGRVRKVQEIQFTIAKSGDTFTITYEPKYNPNLPISEVKDRFFSNKSLEELTQGMTEKELDCIKTGVLREGISKKAVLIAYGYPPKHRTPSLDGNEWRYWINRFRQKLVNFDESGMTTVGREIQGDEI